MKTIILAGGFGTRISEESALRPKPMVEIGEMPVLWHIMKYYSSFGYNEFIICCGYKANVIKDFFTNYYLHHSDITFDFTKENSLSIHNNIAEPWKVTLVDTGINTMTGGRIKRVANYIDDDEFMLTYGDGVSNVDINELIKTHHKSGKIGTLTAIQPDSRFGTLNINENGVIDAFREKNKTDAGWINGGFMIFNKKVIDYIDGDDTVFEIEPLERLVAEGQLQSYKHNGFWKCMDTLRDKNELEFLWTNNTAPWKVWK